MGLFNTVRGRLTCPRCGREVEAEVETRLGYVHEVAALRVGDRYPWNHSGMPSRRPAGGSAVGDGYCECPACGRDFFVAVVVENDVVRGLEVDPRRMPGDASAPPE